MRSTSRWGRVSRRPVVLLRTRSPGSPHSVVRAPISARFGDDQLGEVFRHDIRAIGVDYRTPALSRGASTARCLIFVTPDAERTMGTYLGISVELGPEDIDPDMIGAAKITYLEGYLFDKDAAKEAFVEGL